MEIAMSIIKLHERLERIEAAYLAALGDCYPETVPDSIKRAAILAARPLGGLARLLLLLARRCAAR
jgi:hypothetical protein